MQNIIWKAIIWLGGIIGISTFIFTFMHYFTVTIDPVTSQAMDPLGFQVPDNSDEGFAYFLNFFHYPHHSIVGFVVFWGGLALAYKVMSFGADKMKASDQKSTKD